MSSLFRLLLCCCALTVWTSTATLAQDDEETSKLPERRKAYIDPVVSNKEILTIGLHGGIGMTNHSGSFTGAPGQVSCCPEFSGGSGSGIIAGLETSLPLSDQLRLLGRISIQGVGGRFETSEPTTIRRGNEAVPTSFLHTFETQATMIAIEPAVEYRMGGLGLVGGLRAGLVSSATYTQTEALSDKSLPYTFPNGKQEYLNVSGDLTTISSMQIGLLAGLRYHLALSENLSVIPEVMYAPNFTSLESDMGWGVNSFRVGATIALTLWGKNVIATPLMPK